jgi:hypothetical protein
MFQVRIHGRGGQGVVTSAELLSSVKQADGGTLVLERIELDDTGFPQPTGELEELAADSLVLALGRSPTSACSSASTTCASRTASCRSALTS